MILLRLKPTISKNTLVKALTHDLGEALTGDLPSPFKHSNPKIASIISEQEDEYVKSLGFSTGELDQIEKGLLHLSDVIDAYFWMLHNNVYTHPDSEDYMYNKAEKLNVVKNFEKIMLEFDYG
jgi:hypothetical protein